MKRDMGLIRDLLLKLEALKRRRSMSSPLVHQSLRLRLMITPQIKSITTWVCCTRPN